MCCMMSEASSVFVTNHISEVQTLLIANLSSSHPSSKAVSSRATRAIHLTDSSVFIHLVTFQTPSKGPRISINVHVSSSVLAYELVYIKPTFIPL